MGDDKLEKKNAKKKKKRNSPQKKGRTKDRRREVPKGARSGRIIRARISGSINGTTKGDKGPRKKKAFPKGLWKGKVAEGGKGD